MVKERTGMLRMIAAIAGLALILGLAGPRAMALALPANGGRFELATSSPVKSRQWKTFRRHIALDLIGDTRLS